MTGFGRSQGQTETGSAKPPESDPRAPHPAIAHDSLHAHHSAFTHHPPYAHSSLAMLQQLARHLPLAARQPRDSAATAANPVSASGGDHGLLQALTHSLDLAGRGYCCMANPLEETAAPVDEIQVDAAHVDETGADKAGTDSMGSPKQDAGGRRQ